MKNFERAYVPPQQIVETQKELLKQYPPDEVADLILSMTRDEVYLNDKYQVTARRFMNKALEGAAMVHLSIKRIDKDVIRDWRELQEIKNLLVGEECEAVELFPAESRLVDTANQYHLWCFAEPEFRFPIGWNTRFVSGEVELPDLPRARQRPIQREKADNAVKDHDQAGGA